MELFGKDIPKSNGNRSKINVNDVRKFTSTARHIKDSATDLEELEKFVELLKMNQLILSKEFPPERFMGIINLEYVALYPNATTNEIESALVIPLEK